MSQTLHDPSGGKKKRKENGWECKEKTLEIGLKKVTCMFLYRNRRCK